MDMVRVGVSDKGFRTGKEFRVRGKGCSLWSV